MAQNIKILFSVNGKLTSDNLKKVRDGLKGVGAASKNLDQANKSAKNLTASTSRLATSLKGAASNVVAFIGAYAGFQAIVGATQNVIEFNRAIAEVQTIAKVSRPRLQEIKQSILELSSATGKSATDAARTFYQIQSAGITDVVEAQKVLEASLKLSVGSLANAETTTLALTKAMAVYGDQVQDVTEVSDTLFRGVELGQTNMQELAAQIPQLLGPARNLGISFKDLVGAVASFSKRAGTTGIAVTQIASLFGALAKKQGEAKRILGENSDAFSIQALRAKGLTQFMKDLNAATGGNIEVLTKLFGRKEAAVGFLGAASDGFKDLGDTIKANNVTLGASQKAFETITNEIGGQIDLLQAKSQNLFIKLAVSGEGVAVGVLKGLNSLIDFVSENFRRLSRVAAIFFTVNLLGKGVVAIRGIRNEFTKLSMAGFQTSTALSIMWTKFSTGAKVAKIAMKSLQIGIKTLKAGLTLGLSLAIDVLIEKTLELKEQLGGWGNVWNYFKIQGQIALNSVKEIFQETFIFFQEKLQGFRNLLNKALGKPKDESLKVSIDNRKKQLIETRAELARLNEEKKNLFKAPADNGLKKALDGAKGAARGVAGVDAGGGASPDLTTPTIDPTIKATEDALKEKARLEIEYGLLKNEREMLQRDADFAFLQEKLGTEEALKRTARKKSLLAVESDEKKRAKILAESEKGIAKERAKITIADLKFSDLSNKEKLKQTQNTLQLALGLTAAAGKKFFAIGKAVALSESVVSGILAVQKALSSAPPPLNFINAGIVGATVALNTAKIASSKPPAYRTGGIVSGPTVAGDNQLIQAGSREMVLSRPQQASLFNQIANGTVGGGNDVVVAALNELKDAIMSQPIIVEADGREIAMVVRDQVRSGVTLA